MDSAAESYWKLEPHSSCPYHPPPSWRDWSESPEWVQMLSGISPAWPLVRPCPVVVWIKSLQHGSLPTPAALWIRTQPLVTPAALSFRYQRHHRLLSRQPIEHSHPREKEHPLLGSTSNPSLQRHYRNRRYSEMKFFRQIIYLLHFCSHLVTKHTIWGWRKLAPNWCQNPPSSLTKNIHLKSHAHLLYYRDYQLTHTCHGLLSLFSMCCLHFLCFCCDCTKSRWEVARLCSLKCSLPEFLVNLTPWFSRDEWQEAAAWKLTGKGWVQEDCCKGEPQT